MAFTDWFPDLQWQVFTPELVVLLFALLAPILATKDPDRRGMNQFALFGLGGALLITLGTLIPMDGSPGLAFSIGGGLDFNLKYIGISHLPGYALGDHFVVSLSSQLFKAVFLGVAFLAVLGQGRPLRGKAEEDHGEFVSLLMFATLGMMIVASARDLLVLLLGIEVTSFSSYLLAGFRRDADGAEAGLKYFITGAIASGMSLFAISLAYGISGTTNIPALGTALTTTGGFDAVSVFVILFLLLGLGFKISSVPIHTWAPDVYYGAPTPVAGMLASASKAMGFVAVFNVFLVGLIGVQDNWELAVAIIAAVTMFTGNLIALRQDSLRRMLAYSSIAQAGYVLIALAVATPFAIGAGIFHLMVNAAMKLGAFLIVGGLLAVGLSDRVSDYKGLGKRAPFFAFAMVVFLLSMAGIPPLGGFFSKFFLFSSAVDVAIVDRLGWLIWLTVFAIMNSALSLFYYLRVIRNMYVEASDDTAPLVLPRGVGIAVAVCLVAIVLMGFWSQPFLEISMDAARDLMGTATQASLGP